MGGRLEKKKNKRAGAAWYGNIIQIYPPILPLYLT
jgi:hypothetical protein